MNFTASEEKAIRTALIEFVQRVAKGNCDLVEVSTLPLVLDVMFPNPNGSKRFHENVTVRDSQRQVKQDAQAQPVCPS